MLDTSSKTRIEFSYRNKKTARAIQKAITPDNIDAPDGIHIIVTLDKNKLLLEVDSERSIGSLVSTLDDLLSCIQAAEETLEEI